MLRLVEEVAIASDLFRPITGTPSSRRGSWTLGPGDLLRAELGKDLVEGYRLLSIGFDAEIRGGLEIEILQSIGGDPAKPVASRSLPPGTLVEVFHLCRELPAGARLVLRLAGSGNVGGGASVAGVYLRRVRASSERT